MTETKVTRQRVEPTPGPWRLAEGATNANEADAWGCIDDKDGYHIATIWADTDQLEASAESTARLIAAAPDLYAALKECSFRLAALVAASGDFSDINAKALDQATVAIAKAEDTHGDN